MPVSAFGDSQFINCFSGVFPETDLLYSSSRRHNRSATCAHRRTSELLLVFLATEIKTYTQLLSLALNGQLAKEMSEDTQRCHVPENKIASPPKPSHHAFHEALDLSFYPKMPNEKGSAKAYKRNRFDQYCRFPPPVTHVNTFETSIATLTGTSQRR
jgi:hypothetical protein